MIVQCLLGAAGVAFGYLAWASFELGGERLQGQPNLAPVTTYRHIGFVCLVLCILCWRAV